MQAVEGIYQNGRIKLLETPKQIVRARVIVTFLDDQISLASRDSIVGLGAILVDDLEAASLEISRQFLRTIEKSGAEVGR